eukprot:CCRYP_005276-RB/>CCRYP_005276-RB protein AED:0.35 eAED:0.75 QI:0/0/0/1/0/0/2/0/104
MVIPQTLQNGAVSWYQYHHYLQHPGHTHLEEMLHAAIYWKDEPSNHMSKIVINVKSTNNTSTSTGSSLLSFSSQTLGRYYVWTLLDHTPSKVKMGQKLTLCVLL